MPLSASRPRSISSHAPVWIPTRIERPRALTSSTIAAVDLLAAKVCEIDSDGRVVLLEQLRPAMIAQPRGMVR
jgi:hypothetical protein